MVNLRFYEGKHSKTRGARQAVTALFGLQRNWNDFYWNLRSIYV